ncbi:MAG TPA: YncE family protein [Candidatus Angelobacter sp.]|nr:YncE family protein [Candidatus Angelobacter sp.]
MFRQKLFARIIYSVLLFSGLGAWAGMQQHTVPLPDDDPAHPKVAAPEPRPQEAPATAASGAAATSNVSDFWNQRATISGVKVDFRVVPSLKDIVIKHGPMDVSLNEVSSAEMVEGQQAVVQFKFTDATGNLMRGMRVASWIDGNPSEKAADAKTCHDKIQSFLQMQMSARPEVDLNTYYVLALTEEPGIQIIDPRVGFSSSKLYAVVDLPAAGSDWVLSPSGDRLFVSMPSINRVAAVDSLTFRHISDVDAGVKPGRVVMQADGKYVWIGNDSTGAESGVTVMDATSLDVVAHIATGKGHHEIAFDENKNVYVTNEADGTLSVISIQKLAKVKDMAVGKTPFAMAYSSQARQIYVASRDGKVTAISAGNQSVVAALTGKPGFTALQITRDGRWGFVANGAEGKVLLFDTSVNKFVKEYEVGHSPDSLAFTDSYLYVRSRETADVRLIPLANLGSNSSSAEFPAGQLAPGAPADTLAAPMVASLDGAAAFVANAADRRIYYYQEGMAAPMFSIEGYGRTPKAAMVLDRSIHETSPGVYSVGLRLPKPGFYDVPVYTDAPSMSHCFEFTVHVNPLLKKTADLQVALRALKNNLQVRPGDPATLLFELVDPATGKPRNGLQDVEITVLLAEGLRQMRFSAEPAGNGLYQFTFTPPKEGVYYVTVQIPSLRIRPNQLPYLMIRASNGAAAEVKLPEPADKQLPKAQ